MPAGEIAGSLDRQLARWIAPGGLEPPFPDPKSGVLPLDEGAAVLRGRNLAVPLAYLGGQELGDLIPRERTMIDEQAGEPVPG